MIGPLWACLLAVAIATVSATSSTSITSVVFKRGNQLATTTPSVISPANSVEQPNSDFGSLFIAAILNGTRTAVERYLLSAPDGSPLCSQLSLRLDNRLVANYSTLQVLMIDKQRVQMKIQAAPGFCRIRIVVSGAPLPAVQLNILPRLSDAPDFYDDGSISEPAAPNLQSFMAEQPVLVDDGEPYVVYFNLTASENNLQFFSELQGHLVGYSNVAVQLQQNATSWSDIFIFRISIARVQPFLYFLVQQSIACVLFIANFALGLHTDFSLFRNALRSTGPVVFLAIIVKVVALPAVCFGLCKFYSFEPDLSAVGVFVAAFGPCSLEALLHCALLTTPGRGEISNRKPIKLKQGKIPEHRRFRMASQSEINCALCTASAFMCTVILVLFSFASLPLGAYVAKGLGIPVSLIRDASDKFLFAESASLGITSIPYAGMAISLCCLLLPFFVGILIRHRWRRVALKLYHWLLATLYGCLVYICCASFLVNVFHVLQYVTASTAGGALIMSFGAVWIALFFCICFRPKVFCFIAVALVVGCPNSTISLHVVQANLEPPASDLAALLPTLASLFIQLPLLLVEFIRVIVVVCKDRKASKFNQGSSTDDNTTPTSPLNSLHSSNFLPSSNASSGGSASSSTVSSASNTYQPAEKSKSSRKSANKPRKRNASDEYAAICGHRNPIYANHNVAYRNQGRNTKARYAANVLSDSDMDLQIEEASDGLPFPTSRQAKRVLSRDRIRDTMRGLSRADAAAIVQLSTPDIAVMSPHSRSESHSRAASPSVRKFTLNFSGNSNTLGYTSRRHPTGDAGVQYATVGRVAHRTVHFDETGISIENVADWGHFSSKTPGTPRATRTRPSDTKANGNLVPVVLESVV